MMNPDWTEEFPGMISVCDPNGVILAMNQKEAKSFEEQGRKSLVGTNLFDCHKESSNRIIEQLMETGKTRIYTVEEGGKKEIVIQAPWYQNGRFGGLVEIAVEFESEIQHIVR